MEARLPIFAIGEHAFTGEDIGGALERIDRKLHIAGCDAQKSPPPGRKVSIRWRDAMCLLGYVLFVAESAKKDGLFERRAQAEGTPRELSAARPSTTAS